ncbi:Yhi9p LALA0_S10e04324g [Lachancea lanzarotensis]|uniref:LALA0S10e04324g1_1 n=1 Tax=Lachancea lanzarotensis TaxID=1245769 RepID=A0A0C7MW34_9SACH|nr:uncharacterized protein LALA0_S10e04324g [Lachancea lanzarotensis]CEP64183.1 LALA0S10e04324g1_1 [Lachancea lanzarotensis]
MSTRVPFKQVDVFTSCPYKGNPVAVVNCWDVEEKTIQQATLQNIANWTNLSETTFLFKPTDDQCDYKVRIFTPMMELPFAGHPTLGTCHAYLEFTGRQNVDKIYQQCGLGVIELSVLGKTISFKGAKAEVRQVQSDLARQYDTSLSTTFITQPLLLEVGPQWVVALVENAQTCFDMNVDMALLKETITKHKDATGLIVAGKYPGAEKYEMRAFAPTHGVPEDPVCGSGSLALARYLQELYGFTSNYAFEISQGGRLGRQGKISAQVLHAGRDITYHVGGECISVINGEFLL